MENENNKKTTISNELTPEELEVFIRSIPQILENLLDKKEIQNPTHKKKESHA